MKRNIVILTGSGISQESGIPTFRASDGTWNNVSVEAVATPRGFRSNPDFVHQFYNERRRQLKTVVPNAAHYALAKLEQNWKAGRFLLVTQNVDDLHERAGSKNVHHLHGSLLRVRCGKHCAVFTTTDDVTTKSVCPHCHKAGKLRPDIVWFEEMPKGLAKVYQSLRNCEFYIAIGTSGAVAPASIFVEEAWSNGSNTFELNLEKTIASKHFEKNIFGKATEIVPEFVDKLLAS